MTPRRKPEEGPLTWDRLRGRWDERDNRYRLRRSFPGSKPLQVSPGESLAIREYRRTEVAMLPQATRARALIELNNWIPPVAR